MDGVSSLLISVNIAISLVILIKVMEPEKIIAKITQKPVLKSKIRRKPISNTEEQLWFDEQAAKIKKVNVPFTTIEY